LIVLPPPMGMRNWFSADPWRQSWSYYGNRSPDCADVNANFDNHFDAERHLFERGAHKTRRSVALVEQLNRLA
jgi:hypothetical protein